MLWVTKNLTWLVTEQHFVKEEVSEVSFLRVPSHSWGSTLMTFTSQSTPPTQLPSHWGLDLKQMNVWRTQTFSLSVQFSRSVVSDSLRPHGLQHARPPCPSPTPRVYSNSCPLSQWCHPTISSSVVLFSSCLQSFPVSGSFQVSQFCVSGGQNIGVSASISVLPMNTQDWIPLGWTGWISLESEGLSRVFSNTAVQKQSIAVVNSRRKSGLLTFFCNFLQA